MKTSGVLVLFLALLVACTPSHDSAKSVVNGRLDGAWRLVQSETILPDGTRRPGHFQESFLLFAGDYYSMNWVGGESPSTYFAQQFAPADSEKIARFSSLLINAGRFEVSQDTLTIHPEFALIPEYVGGLGEFDFKLNGDTLDLEWRTIESADGISDPNTAVGVRFYYQWIRR